MSYKAVLTVSALFAAVLAVAVLVPSSDVSDAASEKWIVDESNGLNVEYGGGNYLIVVLDTDPGDSMYKVLVDGKELSAKGKRASVNMGEALDTQTSQLVVVSGAGFTFSCTMKYAEFYEIAVSSLDENAGTASGSGEFRSGEEVTVTAIAAEGYTFDGWFVGDSRESNANPYSFTASKDTELVAHFIQTERTISFDTDGGSEVADIVQNIGTDIKAPANPVREGYTFLGWEPALPSVMPSDNLTVKAKWSINSYTITFDSDGGNAIDSITGEYGSAVIAPTDPTKAGYVFSNWYPAIPGTIPSSDITVKAVWAEITPEGEVKVDIVDAGDSFVVPDSDAKTLTISVEEGVTVKVEDSSNLKGATVVSKIEEIAVPASADVGGSAKAYEFTFTADGATYNGKLQMTLPYQAEAGKHPVVYWQNGSSLERMNIVSHNSTSVTFETDHNSVYIVVADSDSDDSGSTFMMYLCILIVIGIALAMLIGGSFYRRKA